MTVGWQKIRVPLLERVVLLDLATRWGVSEEEALRRVIADAARREVLTDPQRPTDRAGDAHPTCRGCDND